MSMLESLFVVLLLGLAGIVSMLAIGGVLMIYERLSMRIAQWKSKGRVKIVSWQDEPL